MAMMSALVVYVLPGLLGRAFDLRNGTVGPDLFNYTEIIKSENQKVLQQYKTISEYRIVTDMSEATDFLGISGSLALKIKTGNIDIQGSGSYVKETSSFKNRIDLLIKVHCETVVEVLPSSIKPLENWYKYIEGTGHTHYIRSILYGGDLIATVSFIANNEADKEKIKAAIEGEMNAKSGSFGGTLKGSLNKIKNATSSSATMNIDYYATAPLENVPKTIDGLTDLVKKFPAQMQDQKKGRGVPLQMEVFSLQGLQKKERKTYYQTLAFSDLMSMLDEQLTDFRNARSQLIDWLKTVPPVLPDLENEKIGKFNSRLEKLNKVYSTVIGNIDLSKDAKADQFKPALEEYKKGNGYEDAKSFTYPDFYNKELRNLKAKVMENTPSFEVDFGGAHYVYWGSDECPSSDEQVYNGTMTSAVAPSVGSGKFSCLPKEHSYYPDQNPDNEDNDDEDDEDDENDEDSLKLKPIAFVSRKNGRENQPKTVKCATCRIPGKTSSTMLSGIKKCNDGWTQQYKGILVAAATTSTRSELVCLDTSKDFDDISDTSKLTIITEVSVKCGPFPCSRGTSGTNAVPCVVCSFKKPTVSKADVLRF